MRKVTPTPKARGGDGAIIAVDFDGTCVDHRFPEVGYEVPGAVEVLRALVARGHRLILWTMRSDGDHNGPVLEHAREWFRVRQIPLFGVNGNPEQSSWTTSPKAYAQVYIDDAALGAPLRTFPGFARKAVDWDRVASKLRGMGLLPRQVARARARKGRGSTPSPGLGEKGGGK